MIGLNLGLFGIGLATALGQYLQIGLLSLHFLGRDRMLCFVPLRTDWKEMLELLSCGAGSRN